MTRRKILEEFINDKVQTVPPFKSLFYWRGIFYEIIPYKQILRDSSRKASHFVKYIGGQTLYGIREMSDDALKTHYRRSWLELTAN